MQRRRPTRQPHEPSLWRWVIAAVSLVLPWVGLSMALAGSTLAWRGHGEGWMLVAAGAILVVIDMVVDVVLASPKYAPSDEPGLNHGGDHLVGRSLVVVEPIVAGRGKVRAGDTVWLAAGPDAPEGSVVTVQAVEGIVLRVAASPPPTTPLPP